MAVLAAGIVMTVVSGTVMNYDHIDAKGHNRDARQHEGDAAGHEQRRAQIGAPRAAAVRTGTARSRMITERVSESRDTGKDGEDTMTERKINRGSEIRTKGKSMGRERSGCASDPSDRPSPRAAGSTASPA